MKRDLKADFLPAAIGFFAGIALVLLFFFTRGSLRVWQLKPDQARIWEIILKAIAGLLALSGAVVAVLKYFDDKAAAIRANEKEAIRDLLVARQETYGRLIRSMAKIMNYDPGDNTWDDAQAAFFEIYWGELRWVWNDEVERTAGKYSDALFKYMGGSKDELISRAKMLYVRAGNL
jgi:hypothetical protein